MKNKKIKNYINDFIVQNNYWHNKTLYTQKWYFSLWKLLQSYYSGGENCELELTCLTSCYSNCSLLLISLIYFKFFKIEIEIEHIEYTCSMGITEKYKRRSKKKLASYKTHQTSSKSAISQPFNDCSKQLDSTFSYLQRNKDELKEEQQVDDMGNKMQILSQILAIIWPIMPTYKRKLEKQCCFLQM